MGRYYDDLILSYVNEHPEGVGLFEISKALVQMDPSIGRGCAFPPEIVARSKAASPLKRLVESGDLVLGFRVVPKKSAHRIYFPAHPKEVQRWA